VSAPAAPSLRRRIAELRALVDEVAAPGWERSPVWWALLGGDALAEPHGRPGAYLVSDAGPDADTFIAVPGPAPDDAAGRIGWAISSAHAAVRALLARDGSLPAQPLTGDRSILKPSSPATDAPAIAGALCWGKMIAFAGQTRLQAGQPLRQLSGCSTRMFSAPSTP
jgi:hypothetical protein